MNIRKVAAMKRLDDRDQDGDQKGGSKHFLAFLCSLPKLMKGRQVVRSQQQGLIQNTSVVDAVLFLVRVPRPLSLRPVCTG